MVIGTLYNGGLEKNHTETSQKCHKMKTHMVQKGTHTETNGAKKRGKTKTWMHTSNS